MLEFTNNINKIYSENNILTHMPERYYENRIALLVRDPYFIFTYWEIKDQTRQEYLDRLGGNARLIVRIFKGFPDASYEIFQDLHNLDLLGSYHINVNSPDTPFFVQIGYFKDGLFHPVATSNHVVTPRDNYCDLLDEEWMAQEEYYRGLRKLTFDVQGSPHMQDKKSVMLSSKIERVSSEFLKQEITLDTVYSGEETFEKDIPEEEYTEEYTSYGKTSTAPYKEATHTENEILHPKAKQEISTPPDKMLEEPVEEAHEDYKSSPETEYIYNMKEPVKKKRTAKAADVKKTAVKKKTVTKKTEKKKTEVSSKTKKTATKAKASPKTKAKKTKK
ncbi:MAG: DUF4912 domain-containing protein [Armatimonadota bacterium]